MQKKSISIMLSLCTALFCISDAYAKRMAPKKIAPVEYGQYVIRVNHEKMGYIEVYNSKGALLWNKRIYHVRYNPFLERDVQDIYISKMFIDKKLLIIANEKGRYYSLDLHTRKVRSLSEEEVVKYKGPSGTGGE
ncbi:MAG: hypothetical protein JW838_02450 [Spirochaetes bacterium]|nr:hypothetical protein [Spirochaetota bacterium]